MLVIGSDGAFYGVVSQRHKKEKEKKIPVTEHHHHALWALHEMMSEDVRIADC